jgi:predicted membrane protein
MKISKTKCATKLAVAAATLMMSVNAFAADDAITIGTKALKLFSWGIFALTVFGIGWGIWAALTAMMTIPRLAEQQADPQTAKRVWLKLIAGIGAAAILAIFASIVIYLFGAQGVMNALSFDNQDSTEYINFNL